AVVVALAVAPTYGLAWAAALLGLYAAAIAVNLARGRRHLDCGCTGPALRRPISGWLVLRNLVLVAIAPADLAPLATPPLGGIDRLTRVAASRAPEGRRSPARHRAGARALAGGRVSGRLPIDEAGAAGAGRVSGRLPIDEAGAAGAGRVSGRLPIDEAGAGGAA